MKTLLKDMGKHSIHVIKHIHTHGHTYVGGMFAGFAVVKAFFVIAGFLGLISIGSTFAIGGPLATGVTLTGNASVGGILTGSYSYTNPNDNRSTLGTKGFSSMSAQAISLAFNNGTPYIAYQGVSYSDWAHAFKANVMKFNSGTNTWSFVGPAAFSAGEAYYTSLAFDNGTPYIAFSDTTHANKATVMKFNSGTNTWQIVGSAGFSASAIHYLSFVIASGVLYVGYQDGSNGDGIHNGKATVMMFNTGTNTWQTVGNAGFSDMDALSTSLAVDNGVPYLAYQDGYDEDHINNGKATVMKFYTGTNTWIPVGNKGFSDGSLGGPISLVMRNNIPYVAYVDGYLGWSTVMKFNGSGRELIGNSNFSSGGVIYSLALDVYQEIPYVAYQDGYDGDEINNGIGTAMKFNSLTNVWESIGSGSSDGGVGQISFVLDKGIPYMAYEDVAHDDKATVMKYNFDPEGDSLYQWYRDGDPIGGATGINYLLTSNDAGTTITFEVTPVSQSGIQGNAVMSSGMVIAPETLPTIPELLSPTSGTIFATGTINFLRSGVIDTGGSISGYLYQVSSDSGFIHVIISGHQINTGIILTGFTDGTYYRRVLAFDSVGNSGSRSEVWNLLVDTTAPTIPELLSPASGTIFTTGTMNLLRSGSIDSGVGVSGYLYQVSSDSGCTNLISSGSTSLTGIFLTGFTDGIYYRRVSAFDTVGNTGLRSSGRDFIIILPMADSGTSLTSLVPTGGGGGSIFHQDICPAQRDCSSSYYDRICGPCPTTGNHASATVSGDIQNSSYSDEFNTAYQRAYVNGITTIPTIQQAKINGKVTREQLSKMITQYAVKVMKKKVNTKLSCSFPDIIHGSAEMKFYIQTSCQLGLMGREADGLSIKKTFDPKQNVTRAQFATVVSRMLYGEKYNTKNFSLRYIRHLQVLYTAGIINDISTPSADELRGYIMLILRRTTKGN